MIRCPTRSTLTDILFPTTTLCRFVIDFYFACSDSFAYDLAITHAAWVFSPDGHDYHVDRSHALIEGYRSVRPLSDRSEEHTSELQSLMRRSYAVFCLKKKTNT